MEKNGGAFGVEKQTVWRIFWRDGNVFMLFRIWFRKLKVGQLERKTKVYKQFWLGLVPFMLLHGGKVSFFTRGTGKLRSS